MNMLCFNVIGFFVEFLKLYLVVAVLFKIGLRKNIWVSFLTALFMFTVASIFLDSSENGFLCGIVVIVLLSANACEKKNIGLIVLSYIGISIVDMIFCSVCIVVFHLDENVMQENGLLQIGLNLFSLVLILFICLILRKKQKKYQPFRIKKYIVLYLLGGVSLSLYLTAVQFMGMGESLSVYGDDLVIGMSLSSLIMIGVCVLLVINSNQNEHLKREAELTTHLLEAQKEYYTMLLEKERETSAFRHDMKQHLYCMYNLYKGERYAELGKYLIDMNGCVEELSSGIQTGNDFITAIVNDISDKFPDINLQWTGMISNELCISPVDICTIFYNLLLNAFEAVQKSNTGDVQVNIKFIESTMMISVMNLCDREPCMENGNFVTSKPESGHGYGIRNVKKCVEKNRGSYSAKWGGGFFITEVIIPKAL